MMVTLLPSLLTGILRAFRGLQLSARSFKRYSGKKTSKNRDTLIVDVFAEALGEVIARGETDAAQFLREALAGSGVALKPTDRSRARNSESGKRSSLS